MARKGSGFAGKSYTLRVKFADAIAGRAGDFPALLGDGANGTCIVECGFTRIPCDLANLLAPETVRAVHAEYFAAGAHFVESNTYQANRFRLPPDFSVAEVNRAGAFLAREAAPSDRWVLGAIGPAGKPMEPFGHLPQADVFDSVAEQARALAEGGVDGFILETFVDLKELEVSVRAVQSVSDLPILASKAFIEDGEMLAEGLPHRCAQEMASWGVAAVGANCIVGPQRMLDLVRQLAEATDLPIIAIPTPGLPQLVKGQVTYDTNPEYFARAVLRLVEEGARVIGGCCGTTPAHVRALRALLDSTPIKVRKSARQTAELKDRAPVPVTPPSPFREKLASGKFLTAVEMDVPRGLGIEKLLKGAQKLKEAGTDVVNISDGARARLRMNPTAVATILQNQVGIEVVMHFACRDRNLLAIQSDLLGAHALGVRNILAVTGDPANIGDYPSATSVFDIDSIGLCRVLARFNEGIDLAGYSVGVQCGFTVTCAYNPLAADIDEENDRLRRKVEAGAMAIYTQPVFDVAHVDLCAAAADRLGVPVLVGVLPLRSARHAEFMHNEVPGIVIPADLRSRIANAASDEEALEIGIAEAQRLAIHAQSVARGLYLMPPFGSAQMALRVLEAVS